MFDFLEIAALEFETEHFFTKNTTTSYEHRYRFHDILQLLDLPTVQLILVYQIFYMILSAPIILYLCVQSTWFHPDTWELASALYTNLAR